jgi:hypothetical protein
MLLRIVWRTVILLSFLLLAQAVTPILEAEEAPRVMTALKVLSPPKIDGRLDDDCWKLAEPSAGFIQFLPDEGKPATEQTIIKVLYDNENLYFGIECLDTQPEKIDARLVPRDADPYPGDLIGIVLDTFHDHMGHIAIMKTQRETHKSKMLDWMSNMALLQT